MGISNPSLSERLRTALRAWNTHKEIGSWVRVNADEILQALDENEKQAAEIERLTLLSDALKLDAQIHAQEARTANATIAEIYQVVSGGKGEPGNWHGAEPVRKEIERLKRELQRERDK